MIDSDRDGDHEGNEGQWQGRQVLWGDDHKQLGNGAGRAMQLYFASKFSYFFVVLLVSSP